MSHVSRYGENKLYQYVAAIELLVQTSWPFANLEKNDLMIKYDGIVEVF